MILPIIEERLRREHGLPEDFHFYRWECFPHVGQKDLYIELEGGRCPLLTKGKDKGRPNWRKLRDRRTFVVTQEQETLWIDQWEQRTGLCTRCRGAKQVVHSASADAVVHKTCPDCQGSGQSSKYQKQEQSHELDERGTVSGDRGARAGVVVRKPRQLPLWLLWHDDPGV